MDPTRWDTGQVIAAGVLNRSQPKTDIPMDRKEWRTTYTDEDYSLVIDRGAARAALEHGLLLHTNEYYGLVYAWKAADGTYRGTLLQYRNVTEDPTYVSADELLDWFDATSHAVVG